MEWTNSARSCSTWTQRNDWHGSGDRRRVLTLLTKSKATRSKPTGRPRRAYLPTVTPGVVRKMSLRVVAFLSSITCLVRTVVCPGILMIGWSGCDERRLALYGAAEIGIGIAVGRRPSSGFLFPAYQVRRYLRGVRGSRPRGCSLNRSPRVARATAIGGRCHIAEAKSNHRDRDCRRHSSGHVISPLGAILSTHRPRFR